MIQYAQNIVEDGVKTDEKEVKPMNEQEMFEEMCRAM